MKNKNKLLICSTLMLLLCSFLVSSVSATDDNTNREPTHDTPLATDNPVLIAAQDNATTTSDYNPVLIQQRDNSTVTATDPPTYNGESESDRSLLISTQSKPDYTGYLIAVIALVALIAISAFAIVIKRRKK